MTTRMQEPLTLASGLRLANRLAKSAMSERLADGRGAPSEELVRLYERWGRGGAGLLVTGNVMIDRHALGETGNVVVEDRSSLSALSAWARAARAHGSKIVMQINHPGRQSPRTLSRRPVAPSEVALAGEARVMFGKPRALQSVEIEDIIRRFATAAAVAEEAGFDGVQIHGAHGYLISQFLSPHTNRRDDAWGGDASRRRRFVIEVVRAVRAAVSPTFSVGLKLNSADFQRGGFDDEESMQVAAAIDAEGVDLLEVSGGTYESAKMFEETVPTRASSERREAFFLEYVERVRDRVKAPLMLTGGLRTRDGIESALASGVDVAGLARPLAFDPDLPARLISGASDRATPVKLATGIASLDSVIQGSWYQAQIDRMGRGLEPDAGLGRLLPVLRYFQARRGRPWTGADPSAAVRPLPSSSPRSA